MTVQLKRGGDFVALVGLQAALTIMLQRSPEGLHVMIGQQRWVEKAAVGAVGFFFPILWPLMFTAGAGAVIQASLGNRVMNTLDMLVHQQFPNARRDAAPSFMAPFQRPAYDPARPASALICQNCQAANEPDDKFCMQCGKPLEATETVVCPNCGAQMKPNAAFCTKCGTAAQAA